MSDVHCGLYPVAFEAGSVTARVNIPLINDEVSECDETFTAQIIIEGEVNSSSEGLRLGPRSSTSITIKDDEGTVRVLHRFVH